MKIPHVMYTRAFTTHILNNIMSDDLPMIRFRAVFFLFLPIPLHRQLIIITSIIIYVHTFAPCVVLITIISGPFSFENRFQNTRPTGRPSLRIMH